MGTIVTTNTLLIHSSILRHLITFGIASLYLILPLDSRLYHSLSFASGTFSSSSVVLAVRTSLSFVESSRDDPVCELAELIASRVPVTIQCLLKL